MTKVETGLKSRIAWLDVLRTIAILLVVLCHSCEFYYHSVLIGNRDASPFSWLFQNSAFVLGRLGVPLFLMMSGSLLLSKQYDSALHFYKRSLLPLLLSTEIWIVINYIFLCLFNQSEFNTVTLIYEIFMLKTLSLSHMWYMPMILGIYLIIPFLSKLVHDYMTPKQACIPLVVSFVLLFLLPTVNDTLAANIPSFRKFSIQINTQALGGYYVFYVIMGYFMIKHTLLESWKTWIVALCWLFCFLGITLMQRNQFDLKLFKISGVIWYNSAFIAGMGLFTIELFRRLRNNIPEKIASLCEKISKCSFGIFFIHIIVMKLFLNYIKLDFLPIPIRIIVTFIVVFLISAICSMVLCKNRHIGRLLCFYKG